MDFKSLFGALCACIISSSFNANAAYIELNSGGATTTSSGGGVGRAIGFKADSGFSIDSIGIYGNLSTRSYDVIIYCSTDGNQANSELASASNTVGGSGTAWNDIAIDFTFTAGSYTY